MVIIIHPMRFKFAEKNLKTSLKFTHGQSSLPKGCLGLLFRKDATLRELYDLIRPMCGEPGRRREPRLSFALVYPDIQSVGYFNT